MRRLTGLPEWLRTGEAAQAIGESPACLRALADRGVIPRGATPGGQARWSRDALEDWLNRNYPQEDQ